MNVFGILLAGGRSQRFGSDKRFFQFRGKTLLSLALSKFSSFPNVVVVTEPGGAKRVKLEIPDRVGVSILEDPEPFIGPVRSLGWLLEYMGFPNVVVFPVDMPMFPPEGLKLLKDVLFSSSFQSASVWVFSSSKPLPMAMNGAAAHSFSSFVREGGYSFLAWISSGKADLKVLPNDFPPEVWVNINRPEDILCLRD